jgi:hypothetical protein
LRLRRRQRKRTARSSNDLRLLAQAFGGVLLFAAFLLLIPALRETYRWANRSSYYMTEVEIEDPTVQTTLPSASATVVSTGERVSVRRGDFKTATGVGEGTKRYAVWYNPDAVAYLGIKLYDQRVVTAEGNPSFGEAGRAAWHWVAATALAGVGACLSLAPYRAPRST